MTLKPGLAVGMLMSMPFAAAAQQTAKQPDPIDANAAVPASPHESAFKNYRAATDEQASPDKAWRAANEEMTKLGGHAGHMTSDTPPTLVDHEGHRH